MQPTRLHILQRQPHGSEGGRLDSDVRLRGGEHDADPSLDVARPVASASGAEIGSPDGSGHSWWSVRPCDGGAPPGGSRDEGRR
jgi:hypothetical protein